MLFQKADKNRDINGKNRDNWIDRKGKERIKGSLRCLMRLLSPMSRQGSNASEKASLCTFSLKKASLAVETALALPVFFLGMITLISFMDIYRIQTEHLQLLCERTKEAGMYAYALDGSGSEEITLPDVYSYTPTGGLFPLPKIWIHNTVKVHTWTGADHTSWNQDAENPEEMVYITESGSVYHRNAGCRYLNVALDQMSGTAVSAARNSQGEKYYACEICSRGQHPAGIVYLTKNGNRYHNKETCSALKRTVRLVKISQVCNMGACGLCG